MRLDKKIKIIGREEFLTSDVVAAVNELAILDAIHRIVVLPDVHLKRKYVNTQQKISVPSSITVTGDIDAVYPQIRSRGIGCGMILIGTGLHLNDRSKEYYQLQKRLPLFMNNAFTNKHLKTIGRRSICLSSMDMMVMSLKGAPWLAEQFAVPKNNLNAFFNGGSYLKPDAMDNLQMENISKDWINGFYRDGRLIGLDLSGNHFLEAQLITKAPSNTIQLKEGELVFLYHGSCNGIDKIIAPQYVDHIVKRSEYYPFRKGDWEYDLFFTGVNMLLNWSAAARLLVFLRVYSLLRSIWTDYQIDDLYCVSEAPHNSVLFETINGKQQIVYRHNAVPIDEKILIIVSGRNDHCSYLFTKGKKSDISSNSLDHGIGSLLGRREVYQRSIETSLTLRLDYYKKLLVRKNVTSCNLIDTTSNEAEHLISYLDNELVDFNYWELKPIATLKRTSLSVRKLLGV